MQLTSVIMIVVKIMVMIILFTHYLQLIAVPSGPGKALEVPVELIIGTIPLRKTESSEPKLTVKAAVRRGSFDVSTGDLRVSPGTPAVSAKK